MFKRDKYKTKIKLKKYVYIKLCLKWFESITLKTTNTNKQVYYQCNRHLVSVLCRPVIN
jgi:hypothetical protein